MWLLEEKANEKKIRDKVSIEYWIPGEAMFGIPKYSKMLTELADERGIVRNFKKQLVSVNSDHKSAVFYDPSTQQQITTNFDILHIVPPMYTPSCLHSSPLANAAGYVEVNKFTLQSTKYSNVFALGDCISAPNGKTAAAITSQGPILVSNLEKVINGAKENDLLMTGKGYDGYTSCPLVINKSEVILAEFGYDGKILETFSKETGQFPYSLMGQEGKLQRKFFYWMKEQMFPAVYWNLWTQGRWFGNSGPFKPDLSAPAPAAPAPKGKE
jgi:eukaryotic sulfide quinone oxidoreductase